MASSNKLSGVLETTLDIKSPADKYWLAFKDLANLLPKIYPEEFKSITVTKGDGMSPGSIRVIQYVEGHPIGSGTEEIEIMDDEKMISSYYVTEGPIITGFYTKFKPTAQLIHKPDGGCLAKWSVEYEKAFEQVPDPHLAIRVIAATMRRVDEYLLKAN